MTQSPREAALERIRATIAKHGHHVYLILPGPQPRFAYTIGLSPEGGAEYVLAGGAAYSDAEVHRILQAAAAARPRAEGLLEVGSLGSFSLSPVHATWNEALLLGATDFYQGAVPALQLIPDAQHQTLDTPDLSQPRSHETAPAWRWLDEPWSLPIPESSEAVTSLEVLLGQPATEVARWEDDQWEIFAGPAPEVPPEDVRVVPIGVLLAADPSLTPLQDLVIGKGLLRESGEVVWEPWGS